MPAHGRRPLSRLPEARQLAVFLAAGRRSTVYGEQRVCDDLRLLHTAGMSITLRLYPCGHEISPQMLADVDRWIIEQITAGKAQADRATAKAKGWNHRLGASVLLIPHARPRCSHSCRSALRSLFSPPNVH